MRPVWVGFISTDVRDTAAVHDDLVVADRDDHAILGTLMRRRLRQFDRRVHRQHFGLARVRQQKHQQNREEVGQRHEVQRHYAVLPLHYGTSDVSPGTRPSLLLFFFVCQVAFAGGSPSEMTGNNSASTTSIATTVEYERTRSITDTSV